MKKGMVVLQIGGLVILILGGFLGGLALKVWHTGKWKTYRSVPGAYQVDLPAPPEFSSGVAPAIFGGAVCSAQLTMPAISYEVMSFDRHLEPTMLLPWLGERFEAQQALGSTGADFSFDLGARGFVHGQLRKGAQHSWILLVVRPTSFALQHDVEAMLFFTGFKPLE